MRSQIPSPSGKSFLERRDPWGHRLSLWVFGLLLFSGPLALMSLTDLRLDNSIENWLPEKDYQAQVYHWCREQFPEKEQVLLSWDGSTLDDPRIPLLAARLTGRLDPDGVRRDGVPFVEAVVDAQQLVSKIASYGVDRSDALTRAEGNLLGKGWIKVQLTPAGAQEKERTIREIVREAKKDLGLDLQVHDKAVCWQPSAIMEDPFNELVDKWIPVIEASVQAGTSSSSDPLAIEFQPHDFQIGWSGMSLNPDSVDQVTKWLADFRGFETNSEPEGRLLVQAAYVEPGSPVAMLVQLSDAGIANKPAALKAIRQAASECFIPEQNLMMGGRAVAGAALNGAVINSAWNPNAKTFYSRSVIGLSGIVGIVFALMALRSLRLGFLVIGISYYTSILGMAMIPVTGGTMNLVLVVMPTLLMVISLSGAIHVANYWKHASWECPKNAVVRAIQMARQPCLMSGLTTAVGLFSLAWSDLLPVRQFGIYSGIGTLISIVLVLYGLPALLEVIPLRRVRPDDVNPQNWLAFGAFLCRHPALIRTTFVSFAILCACGLYWFQSETKIIRYFPQHSPLVQDYQRIEDTLAGISPVEVIVRFSREAQADYRFLERMEIVRAIETRLRAHQEVSGVLGLPDFRPEQLPPGPTARISDKVFFNRKSNEVERKVKEQLSAGAGEFLAITESPFQVGDRVISADGDELWRINIQASVMSDSDFDTLTTGLDQEVRSVARYYPGVDHIVTGTVPLFLRTQQAVLEGLISSTVGAFGLILLLMIYILKDPVAGLLSMLPNTLPIAMVFGLVSFLGQRIDIGTMVTAAVALGIAVDGTLHLTAWFVDGLERGLSREKSIITGLAHCGPAMIQTSAAITIAMLVLIPADLLLISRFGILMAALIVAATLADVVLLPTMLMGSLGNIIEKRIRKKLSSKVAHKHCDEAESSDDTVPNAGQRPVIPGPHIPLSVPAREGLRSRDNAGRSLMD